MKKINSYKVLVHDYCDQTYEEKIIEAESMNEVYSYFGGREGVENIEYLGSMEIPDSPEEEKAQLDEAIAKRLKWMDETDGFIVGYYPKGKIDVHYSFYKMPEHIWGKSDLREIYSKLEKDPYFDYGLISIERYSRCKDNYTFSGFITRGIGLHLTIERKK